MQSRPASHEDIDSCHSLLLLQMTEPYDNSLRIVVGETSLGERQNLSIPGSDFVFENVRPITHREDDRIFALTWASYIAFAISNESWALPVVAKKDSGKYLRRLQGSTFERYVAETTFYDGRYGPMQHWIVGCEHHLIDIISADEPSVEQLIGYGLPDREFKGSFQR